MKNLSPDEPTDNISTESLGWIHDALGHFQRCMIDPAHEGDTAKEWEPKNDKAIKEVRAELRRLMAIENGEG